MAVLGIEVVEVGKAKPPVSSLQPFDRLAEAFNVVCGSASVGDALATIDVLNFPETLCLDAGALEHFEHAGEGGGTAKSRRLAVGTNAPGRPMNGLAMTRLTRLGGTSMSRALAHQSHRTVTGTTSSCAAT